MKSKLKKLLKDLIFGIIGLIIINICTLCSLMGICGLLQKMGTNLQNIAFIKNIVIIISVCSLIYTLLYILLSELNNKKVIASIMLVSGVIFAICLGKCYGSYFSDLFNAVLSMNTSNSISLNDVLSSIFKYAVIGVINLCIFIYTYVYKILRDVLTKMEKDK